MRILVTCSLLLLSSPAFALTVNSKVVIDRTYNNSYEGKSTKLNKKLTEEDLLQTKSQYDTGLSGNLSYNKNKSQRASTVFGTNTSQTNYSVGGSQLLPTGTLLTAELANIKETTDSAFSTTPSYHNVNTTFTISQPLLKNGLGYQTRKKMERSKQLVLASEQSVQNDLMKLALNNLNYYWNWYMQSRHRIINKEALSAAARLYRTNRQKMVIGLIEETDLYAFAANVDLKKSDLYLSEVNLNSAESFLRVAINHPYGGMNFQKEKFGTKKYPSVNKMIDEALKAHPGYLALKLKLKAQGISVDINKNDKLPQLNLTGSVALNGIDPSFDNAAGNVTDGNTIWAGGLNVSFPLQNRFARGAHRKTEIQKTQLLYQLKNLENQIITIMREGYKKYQKAYSRMRVVATAVNHQHLKWEGEITRYDQGRSDPDIVIRYQDDYLNAQKLYVQAQVEFQLAKAELDYFRGKLGK